MWPVMILGISGWWFPFSPFFSIYPSSLGGDNSQLDSTLTHRIETNPIYSPKTKHPGWTLKTSSRSSKPKWKSTAATARSGMAILGAELFSDVFFVQTFDDDPTDSDSSWFSCEAIHSHGMPWVFVCFCCPEGRHFWGLFIRQDSRSLRAKRMIPKAIKRWVSEDWVWLMKIGGSGSTPVVAILMRNMMITLW